MNIEVEQIKIGSLTINVTRKDIKNIHLSVYPPGGDVKISAPLRMDLESIRLYVLSKFVWIKSQQSRFRSQVREVPREYINRESHYYRGKRYLLQIIEENAPTKVVLRHHTLELHVRPGTPEEKRQQIMEEWYRSQLKRMLPLLIAKWEKNMGVEVTTFGIKKMKTKWGTCNSDAKRIWLNLELAKKPQGCLEYILVHEMVHLLERKHNDRFIELMTEFFPKWKYYQEKLKLLPMKQETWNY